MHHTSYAVSQIRSKVEQGRSAGSLFAHAGQRLGHIMIPGPGRSCRSPPRPSDWFPSPSLLLLHGQIKRLIQQFIFLILQCIDEWMHAVVSKPQSFNRQFSLTCLQLQLQHLYIEPHMIQRWRQWYQQTAVHARPFCHVHSPKIGACDCRMQSPA